MSSAALDPVDDLPELIERFGTEDKCHQYLEELRWPEGVECPRCQNKSISRIAKRRQFECNECRYQFSVRVGTVFSESKLPLWKWFLAVYLMGVSKKGISANQLKGMVGVSYKTAWFLCHRIRSAMPQSGDKLTGTVEVDETWVGGKRKGVGSGHPKTRDKTMLMGAIQRGGNIRIRIEPHGTATKEVLHRFVTESVEDSAEAIYTDGAPGYTGIGDDDTRHEKVSHWDGEYVRGDVHTNSVEGVWSLFKRSLIGAYHQLSVKHLDAYLDEFTFRFNNRKNPFIFRDTIRALIAGDQLTYQELIADK